MGLGEATNFIAYTFAPASVVTALGVLSVLVSALLSALLLHEHLNLLGKLGCLLCLLGSTVIVLHTPLNGQQQQLGYTYIVHELSSPAFLWYCGAVAAAVSVAVWYLVPRYGRSHLLPHLIVCSLVGSLMVMGCKCLGLMLAEQLAGRQDPTFSWLLPTALILAIAAGIALQMSYLNRALDLFHTCIVTPVYYVMFTSAVMLASSVLFGELSRLAAADVAGCLAGFATIVVGVLLLNAFKHIDISLADVRGSLRHKTPPSHSPPPPDITTISNSCSNKTDTTYL